MRKCITVLLTAFLLGCFSNCTIPYSSIWISNDTDDTVKIYMNYRDSLLPAYIPHKTAEWKERCSQCFSVEYVFKNPPKLIYGSKDEGGRHSPFFTGYRPQFYFRTTDITGTVTLPAGKEMVMPGDHTEIEVELIHKVAMDKGLRFAIREGGRTVASGQVTEIKD